MSRVQLPSRSTATTVHSLVRAVAYTRTAWVDDWELCPYLTPISATNAVMPTMPHALLRYDHGTVKRADRTGWETFDPLEISGQYVQIRAVSAAGEQTLWTGIITDPETQPDGVAAGAAPEGVQFFRAWGLGHVLDQITLRDAHCLVNSVVVQIGRVPEVNARSAYGMALAGNRSSSASGGSYVFGDDGAVWSNLQFINYLLAWHLDETELSFTLGGLTSPLDDVIMRHRLDGLSLWQCLEHLVPRRRGFVCWIEVRGDQPEIVINTVFGEPVSVGDVTVPANTRQHTLNFSSVRRVQQPVVRQKQSAVYDKVIVEGAHIKSCFTVSIADGSLERAWTQAEEDAYQDEDDENRKDDRHQRVFTTFRVPRDWAWTIGAAEHNVVPTLQDDGTLPDNGPPARQFPPGKAFLRALPFEKAAAAAGAEPEMREPFAFASVTHDGIGRYVRLDAGWKDADLPGMELRPLDRELAFHVRSEPNHLLGLNHFDPAGVYGQGESKTAPIVDYEDIIATVCVEADQRLRVVAAVPGREDVVNPRTLVLRVPGAELWYVAAGTIEDVQEGSYFYALDPSLARDDSARLRTIAALATAWYGASRAAVSFRLAVIDPFNPLGAYIRAAFAGDWNLGEVGTVVTSVAWDFLGGETAYETGYQELDLAALADVPGMSDLRSVARTVRAIDEELQAVRERVGNFPARWAAGGGGGSGTTSRMIIAKADMPADDTAYNCAYLEADGTEGLSLTCKRPYGIYISSDAVGFLGKDSSGANVFIPANMREEANMPLVVETRTSDPGSPVNGRIWERTDY